MTQAKRKRSNPLALAVLVLLYERPMHPYEMAATLRERHKEDSIKLRYGSLYTVIALLVKVGFIVARHTCDPQLLYRLAVKGFPRLHLQGCMEHTVLDISLRSGDNED